MVNSQCSAAAAPIYKYLKHSTFEKWASDNLLFIIVTLLYRDHPQRNCALSSPLNASLVSLRSSTPEKKTAGESKILFGISRSSKKGRTHLFQNMLLKNGSMGSSLGEVEKLSQELADVEIHCKDGIIRWNRSLLASWSPLLRLQCN